MQIQKIIDEIIDHFRGMWRFRWTALLVAWGVSLFGWYFVYTMPNIYQASARVSVDTNSLLPSLTKGLTASENLLDEVEIVSKALLTRPNLAEVARQTDFDLRADDDRQMEALITSLQKNVRVTGGRDNIFNISFEDPNRAMARSIVSALLDTFVESSLDAQGSDSEMTERALAVEIQDHENRLISAENDLAEFKKRNIGYMPNDGADYYTRLQTALTAVDSSAREIRLVRERRDELVRQIEGEEPVFGLMPSTATSSSSGCALSGRIAQLQGELATLLVDYTEKHPRAVMLQETIQNLQDQCASQAASMPRGGAVQNGGENSLDQNPVYQNLRIQLSNAEVELASINEQHRTNQVRVERLRRDVDKIAEVETALKRLNRDYDVVNTRHQTLLTRWETLQSKKRLDPVTDQVQFNVLEPPFAPLKPVAPNRPVLLSAVLIFALGIGAAITFALNQLRPVFYTRQTVSSVAGIPVLGSISLICSPDEIKLEKRKTLVWVAGNACLVALSVVVITFQEPVSAILRQLLGGVGA